MLVIKCQNSASVWQAPASICVSYPSCFWDLLRLGVAVCQKSEAVAAVVQVKVKIPVTLVGLGAGCFSAFRKMRRGFFSSSKAACISFPRVIILSSSLSVRLLDDIPQVPSIPT